MATEPSRRSRTRTGGRGGGRPAAARQPQAASAAETLVGPAARSIVARRSAVGEPETPGGKRVVTLGWTPDLPDFRDFTLDTDEISGNLKKQKSILALGAKLPRAVDFRDECSPVEDQGRLGSCTAQSVVGMMEYMMRRGNQRHMEGSRLFLYKVTRKLLGWTGDTGAYLRTIMQAVASFGIPPEKYHPYDIARYEEEPVPFLYSFAANFKAVRYARMDPKHINADKVLDNVKHALEARYPVVFGFTVYSSLSSDADIPFPTANDSVNGGHAVMAVGYDDDHTVGGRKVPSLIIRNSWGTGWGEDGYGYLPYAYVEQGLARDFWAAFEWDWIRQGQFG